MLFDKVNFLFLPNNETGSIGVISKSIIQNGGKIISSYKEIDQNTVVLINDTYIDTQENKLIRQELFRREFTLEYDKLIQIIEAKGLKCIPTSTIPKCIEEDKLDLSQYSKMSQLCGIIHISDESRPLSSNKSSEESTDVSFDSTDSNSRPYAQLINVSPAQEEKIGKSKIMRTQNDNRLLINAMGKLFTKYSSEGDVFRARSYKLAKASIENTPFRIKSGDDARRNLKHIGPSIARKIQLILDQGYLAGLNETLELSSHLNYFMHCYGVGANLAKRWDILNLKTFDDVVKNSPHDILKQWPILLGWAYYEDWGKMIPRKECEEHLKIVRSALRQISSKCEVEILGSYIRGKENCGDIDLLFYSKDCNDTGELGPVMAGVVLELVRQRYVQCTLQMDSNIEEYMGPMIQELFETCKMQVSKATTHHWREDKILKKYFLGVKLDQNKYRQYYSDKLNEECKKLEKIDSYLSKSSNNSPDMPVCRRLDFFCCKWSELGAARLHYTGSGEFNRWLRLRAISQGLSLTQHGLFKENKLIESYDEKNIFKCLGLNYIEPHNRTEGQWDRYIFNTGSNI
ncbi:similar to Saccharomyces cerevisiae YCR014C POL4 DNA polymerase IV [Maudiozyma barnettii]|uniref:DNA polymerase n=1 Tax=Maudiozyma barnettii TaxID=61262 RepID=A0A8H2VGD0_9SACH|nr:DNA-directed DNA polymerase IV [Kazachstania barnettii]CAB4254684.1 similar to Saccharomyces cerevisiae YCR014C POL4 DNA polymerase IV [Kazachstania barnettii]CAD1782726.1 similar to Saccharomyces cerevisiae YCR014C POL4 DNA polymerase IV [Kazachstania barnettii]